MGLVRTFDGCDFDPPISVPEDAHIETHGQLVRYAIMASEPNPVPEVAEKLAQSVGQLVDDRIAQKPPVQAKNTSNRT